ncbi:MAG: hypothetical protein WCJ31_09000 [Planctomycetia bacterium]
MIQLHRVYACHSPTTNRDGRSAVHPSAASSGDDAPASPSWRHDRSPQERLEVATKTGTGVDTWIEALLARRLALLESR